jgi:hypothetical protein
LTPRPARRRTSPTHQDDASTVLNRSIPDADDFNRGVQRIADAPLHSWLGTFCVSALVVLVFVIVHRIGARIVHRIARPYPLLSVILRYIDKPSLVTLVLLALEFVWLQANDAMSFVGGMRSAAAVSTIVSLTWLLVRLAAGVGDAIIEPIRWIQPTISTRGASIRRPRCWFGPSWY